jgi:beta-lactamase regulating signal transducer with metallopeptidase domain
MAAVEAACAGGGFPWKGAFLLGWLAGVALLGAREARRHLALRDIRRSLEPAGARGHAALDAVLQGLPRRSIRLCVSDRVDTPCVLDARTVVLPPRCQDELGEPELVAVLAHETAHIGRKDVFWQSLFRWTAVLLWFQPLNGWVRRRLHEVAELICDDWAVNRIPSPMDLARSISRVAEWSLPTSRRRAVLVGSQGGRLSERVRRILGRPHGSAMGGRRRSVLVAAALVGLLTQVPTVSVPSTFQGVLFLDEAAVVGRDIRLPSGFESSGGGPQSAEGMLVRVRRVGARP